MGLWSLSTEYTGNGRFNICCTITQPPPWTVDEQLVNFFLDIINEMSKLVNYNGSLLLQSCLLILIMSSSKTPQLPQRPPTHTHKAHH